MDESKKVTWQVIYDDFVRRHPNLSKDAVDYRPHSYATIIIWFKGGKKMLYNYDEKKAKFYVEDKLG